MNPKEQIKTALSELVEQAQLLIKLVANHEKFIEFGNRYQDWYTKSLKVVSFLAPDRLSEFRSNYEIDARRKTLSPLSYVIQDYVRGIGPVADYKGELPYKTNSIALIRLVNQRQILASLTSRIDGVLADLEGTLVSNIQDTELSTAQSLKKINLRAAGALAGVILEGHLQRVINNHAVPLAKKNPTIADMNDPLRIAGVYDMPTSRKIQFLADVRNICSHKKDQEPTKDQIDDLLTGVDWVLKNVS